MNCPYCGHRVRCIGTTHASRYTSRSYKCAHAQCWKRFTTVEYPVARMERKAKRGELIRRLAYELGNTVSEDLLADLKAIIEKYSCKKLP